MKNRRLRYPIPHQRWSPARQAGQVLILVALLMPVFMASLGLAVDLSLGFASRRLAQNTADAGAFGGAILVGDNSSYYTFTDLDIQHAFEDSVKNSSAPSTIHWFDPTSSSATNAIGTLDVSAQYIDSSGNVVQTSGGTNYIQSGSTGTIPSGAQGLKVSVSWPQSTYFGAVVGWQKYTISASAAYVVTTVSPNGLAVAPFTVWWDPPYGASTVTQYTGCGSSGSNQWTAGQYVATCNSVYNLCHAYVASPPCGQYGDAPVILPPPGTYVTFFGNGYQSAAGATNDPDYTFGSSNFKGDLLTSGGTISVCTGTPFNDGNGNHGNNSRQVLQNAVSMINGSFGNVDSNGKDSMAIAIFPTAYYSSHSGAVYVSFGGFVPVLIDTVTVAAAGNNGTWSGTVVPWTFPGVNLSVPSCSNGSGGSTSGGMIKTVKLLS